MSKARIEIRRYDVFKESRWVLVNGQGKTIAQGNVYKSKSSVKRAALRAKRLFASAKIKED